MRTAGVIAEFNPFHDGHAYLFRKIRESGCGSIIVVMSGDFVQRGECAICGKYDRTVKALKAGADLVLELPAAAAVGSAQIFAQSAVNILDALSIVDELWFGSESGDIAPFISLGHILTEKEDVYAPAMRQALKLGKTFPAARAEALAKLPEEDRAGLSSDEILAFLSGPNNILGLEYVRALLLAKSPIVPKTIVRAGSAYLDTDAQAFLPSAYALRKAEKEGRSTGSFSQAPLFADDFSLTLMSALLEADEASLTSLADISPELARRILALAGQVTEFTAFAGLVKTRNMTYTHVSRALVRIMLGISRAEQDTALAPAAVRLLGLRESPETSALFAGIKEKGRIRLISSAKEYHELTGGRDAYAANLYNLVLSAKTGTPFVHEFTRKVVKI
ncbi:MAG: nucleotidyltransferase family protein [Eubacterium sp.]|nr:nucleotidyltransferase family protein [Eubacterium sp.]